MYRSKYRQTKYRDASVDCPIPNKFVKFSYFSLCLQEHVFNPLKKSSYFLVLSEIATD